ncbi:MAG: Uncharacterised protein [Synechococcus sp. MIT S9220]|nr:MAG: Uncharacterised protein [Synechococcus sp. MIT S9220]
MDLVVHQVNQLEEMGVTHRHRLIKRLTGAAIDQLKLAGVIRVVDPLLPRLFGRCLQKGFDGLLGHFRAIHLIEGHDLHSAVEIGSGPTHQELEHLADIHSAGNAERIQHDVHRSAIGEVRHVLTREDAADDSLVAMAAGHLVANLDLAALSHIHTHHHVGAGGQLITLFAGVNAYIHDTSTFGAGHPQ